MCYVVDIEMSSSTSIQSPSFTTFMSNNDSLSSTPSSTNAPSPSEPSTTTPNVASTTSGPSSSGNYGQIKSVYVISISILLLQLQVATTQYLVLHF